MITTDTVARIQAALGESGLDGWLLFDFRGINPIATGLIGLPGMVTRRYFVYVPARGTPTAVTHAIEQSQWAEWPGAWTRVVYGSWKSLDDHLAKLVGGKRIAMEYSTRDDVPYLDRVPAGVIDLVRAAGATIVSSGELVSRFFAAWNDQAIAAHLRAAEAIAGIARDTMRWIGDETCANRAVTEYDAQQRILAAFERLALDPDHPPHVCVGPNAADPHYEPTAARSSPIQRGDVLLIDLWARERGGPFADQTWMATLGEPSAEVVRVWEAVRDARDVAIDSLRTRLRAGEAVRGAEIDDATRAVIVARGYGDQFTHRTGHSIDTRDIHGSGPNIDNLETHDDRLLIPGVGFSIEPGVYLTGRFGVRSEVNAYVTPGDVVITPREYQRELTVI